MPRQIPTVAIGIPAFNEEHNIAALLQDLRQQETKQVQIKRIIVVNDASTDKTAKIVQSSPDPRVSLITNKKRLGQAHAQNSIIAQTTEDILVLLNADIRVTDRQFIQHLTRPLWGKKIDLTSCRITPVAPTTFFERILVVSSEMKQYLYESYKHGHNLYTCHGRARAFSRQLYTILSFPVSIGEDAYSYLFCQIKKLRYQYVPETAVFSKCPDNLYDHEKQSVRFLHTKETLGQYFDEHVLQDAYFLPRMLLVYAMLHEGRRHPIHLLFYIMILVWMQLRSRIMSHTNNRWEISTSSKRFSLRRKK